jgi:hypothetical protein
MQADGIRISGPGSCSGYGDAHGFLGERSSVSLNSMNHRLENVIRRVQQLPEIEQDWIASVILDELEEASQFANSDESAVEDSDEAGLLLVRVRDRETFLAFVSALVIDRENAIDKERDHPTEHLGMCPDAGGWYNFDIESYLEAALAWARSTGMKLPRKYSEEDLWRAFAEFLYLGKLYE